VEIYADSVAPLDRLDMPGGEASILLLMKKVKRDDPVWNGDFWREAVGESSSFPFPFPLSLSVRTPSMNCSFLMSLELLHMPTGWLLI
jgi:hypothetical protein